MPHMKVIPIIEELLVLTGETQKQFAKRLGVSQSTISKWLSGQGEPGKSQWDLISDLYFELKGWQSIDDQLKRFEPDFQENVHTVVDIMIKTHTTKRLR